eukprot:scaffold143212_cov21-Tisochrysis_lutea.AAC.1
MVQMWPELEISDGRGKKEVLITLHVLNWVWGLFSPSEMSVLAYCIHGKGGKFVGGRRSSVPACVGLEILPVCQLWTWAAQLPFRQKRPG